MSRMHTFLSFLTLSTAFIRDAWTSDESKDASGDRKIKKAVIARNDVENKLSLSAVVDSLIQQKTPEAAFDILALLTGEELSQGGKKGSFSKKKAPTEEDSLAVIKGMRYVVSTFSGNFPLKTYFLDKIDQYTEQGKAFKAHMTSLYTIGRYFEHLMHAVDAKATYLSIADDFEDNIPYEKALKILPAVNNMAKLHNLDHVRKNEPHRVVLLNAGDDNLIENSPLGMHYLKGGVELPSEVLVPTFNEVDNSIIKMETLSSYDETRLTPIVARQNPDHFLINQYDEFLIYRFLLTDMHGNEYLCGYLDPNQSFVLHEDISKKGGLVGKILFLSSGQRSDDIINKAENLSNTIDSWRGSLYPIQELTRGDHDGLPMFNQSINNNQNLVGLAPFILKDLIPAGYVEDHLRERGIINLTQIENPEVAFTPLRLEQFESPYDAVIGPKKDLTRALQVQIEAEKERQTFLDNAAKKDEEPNEKELKKLNKKFRIAKSEADEARGALDNGRAILMDSIREPLIRHKTINYTPVAYDGDDIVEGGRENIEISYITNPAHLKSHLDNISNRDFIENNEYYMIQADKTTYDLMLKAYGPEFAGNYYDMLYRDFYTPRILYRLDKRTWILNKESDGLLGPDMIHQLNDLAQHLNKKYENQRGDAEIEIKKLDAKLGYEGRQQINIDQDRAERNIYKAEPMRRAVQVNTGDIKRIKIDGGFAAKMGALHDAKKEDDAPIVRKQRIRARIPGDIKQVK